MPLPQRKFDAIFIVPLYRYDKSMSYIRSFMFYLIIKQFTFFEQGRKLKYIQKYKFSSAIRLYFVAVKSLYMSQVFGKLVIRDKHC